MNVLERALFASSTIPSVGEIWAFVHMKVVTGLSVVAITKFSKDSAYRRVAVDVHVGNHARRISASPFQEIEAVRRVLGSGIVRQRTESIFRAGVLIKKLLAESQFMKIVAVGASNAGTFAYRNGQIP